MVKTKKFVTETRNEICTFTKFVNIILRYSGEQLVTQCLSYDGERIDVSLSSESAEHSRRC